MADGLGDPMALFPGQRSSGAGRSDQSLEQERDLPARAAAPRLGLGIGQLMAEKAGNRAEEVRVGRGPECATGHPLEKIEVALEIDPKGTDDEILRRRTAIEEARKGNGRATPVAEAFGKSSGGRSRPRHRRRDQFDPLEITPRLPHADRSPSPQRNRVHYQRGSIPSRT